MVGIGIFIDLASVAPHAGAWIEILLTNWEPAFLRVAPPRGAWIEMNQL